MVIWRDVPGFEGKYQVSNTGLVKSLPRQKMIRTRSGICYQNVKERILKTSPDKDGYLQVLLSNGGRKMGGGVLCRKVHKLVALAFLPNPLNKPMVNHKGKDGDKTNNHVDNLEWATHVENEAHASKYGLKARGSDFSTAKLSEEDIPIIRKRIKRKHRIADIARDYGVNFSIIAGIRDHKLWKHV